MQDLTRRSFLATPAALSAAAQLNQPGRDLLSGTFPLTKLSDLLLPRNEWRPFPRAADRAAWSALPIEVRQRMIEGGARELGTPWPFLLKSDFFVFWVTQPGKKDKK